MRHADDRLSRLRHEVALQGLDGVVVPRADEHLGEYVPPGAERLAWLTGFTGSAGLAAVLPDRAAAWTDGRYVLQLDAQAGPEWTRLHVQDDPPASWLKDNVRAGARIGYDPHLISAAGLAVFTAAGLDMVPTARNAVDAIWADRAGPPLAPVVPHPFAGKDSADKRAEVAAALVEAGQDAAVLTDPASVNWLLNVRGGDLQYTPVALGFALLRRSGDVALFMDLAKLAPETRDWLGNGVAVSPPQALEAALQAMRGQVVRVDRAGAPVWFAQVLEAAGAKVVDGPDPCALPKACKNKTERAGARAAHGRDAVALCRFLHWLAAGRPPGTTEMAAAERLLQFREELDGFREESFPAISGAGPNGAVIHYRVSPDTDRVLADDEAYLIDSGAQFPDGTTDVTRTVWTGPGEPPAELRDRFTRVLQGHIAIATAVFPQGVAGPHLDALARRALWQAGLDYDHGTGHGVGSFLSVHEGPCSLSRNARPVALAPGMILSDEPGFYQPGAYGIRLENLLLVRRSPLQTRKPFLCFETLTLAPFDRALIEPSLLTGPERDWLDGYHARVLAEVGSKLDAGQDGAVLRWLRFACAPL